MTPKRFAWLVIVILIGCRSQFAQNKTFYTSTGEAHVDVLVTRDGSLVNNLKATDFEVFDNGVRQKIVSAELQLQMPIDAILVFDMSSSIKGELLDHLKDALHELLSDFSEKDRAALITFNQAVVLGSPLTGNFELVKSALEQTQPSGNSSLIDACYAGLILAKSGSELPLMIIFSDGRDTFSWLTGEMVLETAKRNNSVVYAISTQRRPKKSFLNDLTSFTGGNLFEVESTGDLASAFLDAIREFRYRYLLAYTPEGVSGEGWHELDVRVKSKSVKVRYRPGYIRGATDE
jgi:VWFA-related protein